MSAWLLAEILAFLHLRVSPESFGLLHFLFRKLAHLTEYAVLSLLVYASFLRGKEFEWHPRIAFRSVLVSGLYSLTDEFHQSFVPGRTASIMDCGIDTTGAVLGMLALYGIQLLGQAKNSRTAAESARAADA